MTIGTDDGSLPLVAAVAAMALIPGAVMEWAAGEPVVTSSFTHFALVLAGALAAAPAPLARLRPAPRRA